MSTNKGNKLSCSYLESKPISYSKYVSRNENVRRKHNYVQLAIDLITALAKKGKLGPMIERGNSRVSAAAAAAGF